MSNDLSNKKFIHRIMGRIAEAKPATISGLLGDAYHEQAHWRGSHPFNELQGSDAIAEYYWKPLLASFPDLERRDEIVMGGSYEGRDYVGCVGHLSGTFRNAWLGIPATGKSIFLRYGEFHQLVDGKIAQSSVLIDVLDAIRQAGIWPIVPSLGLEGRWSGPFSADGLLFAEQDPETSAASLELTLAMHQSLTNYDDDQGGGREGLLNMPQKQFWHPKMMRYGPSGIGTTRGLDGFVDQHQLPFRIAFPNRRAGSLFPKEKVAGGGHCVRIGDGHYSATSGWPSVYALHSGGDWLGMAPTGRPVIMRVMDFYLEHENLIRENWVPIDIIHILLQMGVDVLGWVQGQFGHR